eukprot:m.1063541 g.1063541  ORF g.1063541 m.1063541 type:complete len:673 (+) comp24216_c0_seq16:218-2236(+)
MARFASNETYYLLVVLLIACCGTGLQAQPSATAPQIMANGNDVQINAAQGDIELLSLGFSGTVGDLVARLSRAEQRLDAIESRESTFSGSYSSAISLGLWVPSSGQPLQVGIIGVICGTSTSRSMFSTIHLRNGGLVAFTTSTAVDDAEVGASFDSQVLLQYRPIGNGFQLQYASPRGTTCAGSVNISIQASAGEFMSSYTNGATSPSYQTMTGTSFPLGNEAPGESVSQLITEAIAAAAATTSSQISNVNSTLSARIDALGTTQQSLVNATEELGVAIANVSSTLSLMNNCSAVGQIAHESGLGCRPALALCPSLSAPTNGAVSSVLPAEPGLSHTFSCNSGFYIPTSSPSHTTCRPNGTWTFNASTCAACASNCALCTNSSVCLRCNTGNVWLIHGQCFTQPPGSQQAPAESCTMVRRTRTTATSGLYYIRNTPTGTSSQRYCDLTSSGGGWELVWKLAGGATRGPAPIGVQALFNGAGDHTDAVMPPIASDTSSQGSGLSNYFFTYFNMTNVDWLKKSVAYNAGGAAFSTEDVVHTFVNGSVMSQMFTFSNTAYERCPLLPAPVTVSVNGISAGSSRYGLQWSRANFSFGFPTTLSSGDLCGPAGEPLLDPAAFDGYAGGTIRGAGRLRHWFGYVFPSSGRDAVRCNACCWGGACAATYETNAWYVRLR